MPTYAYACRDCGHDFEVVQSFTDDSLTICPVCHGQLRKVFANVGVVFKGSGFYRNDSRGPDTSAGDKSSSDKSSSDKGSGEKKSAEPAAKGSDQTSAKGSDKSSDKSSGKGSSRDKGKPSSPAKSGSSSSGAGSAA